MDAANWSRSMIDVLSRATQLYEDLCIISESGETGYDFTGLENERDNISLLCVSLIRARRAADALVASNLFTVARENGGDVADAADFIRDMATCADRSHEHEMFPDASGEYRCRTCNRTGEELGV